MEDEEIKFNEKHVKEAENAGLIILEKGTSRGTYKYKFLSCGHEYVAQATNVKRKNAYCKTCFEETLRANAVLSGLDLIDAPIPRNNYRVCRFISCGHIQDVHLYSIRDHVAECKICKEEKFKSEALAVGLELIEVTGRMGYRKYRFVNCGHEQEISLRLVRENEFKCQQCHNAKLHSEAMRNGLTLIGKGKRDDFKLYKFNSCGHEQDLQPCVVRNGAAKCRTCNSSFWDFPSHLYVLKITCDDFSWIKIGHAQNIQKRIKAYGLPENSHVEILFNRLYSSSFYSQKEENRLHKYLSEKQISPDIMKNYHIRSGFTECFESDLDLSEVFDG